MAMHMDDAEKQQRLQADEMRFLRSITGMLDEKWNENIWNEFYTHTHNINDTHRWGKTGINMY